MADFFANSLGFPWPLAYLVAAAIQCGLILGLIAGSVLFFIWLERKVSGRIQDRLGPTRVGGKFGWLQTLADGIKLFCKEDLAPGDADRVLFRAAPYISFCASFTAFLALPFANGWVALDVNIGVFFILAVLGLEVFGVILAGYASGSKWSLFGAMREAAQVVSYEVPLGICAVIPVLLVGSMNLTTISNMQAGWFTNWLIFHDPFTFCVFWVYFTCAMASVNRAPFDLAEAESELVAGFLTEYSGLRWSYFFMAEYASMLLVSGLAAILFFGGWNGPIPIFHYLGMAYESGETAWTLSGFLANLGGCANFLAKALIGVIVMMWVRWTLPRLRIDQVMTLCLKYCVPLAAFGFVGVLTWQVIGLPSPNHWLPLADSAGVHEPWTDQPAPDASQTSEGNRQTSSNDRPTATGAEASATGTSATGVSVTGTPVLESPVAALRVVRSQATPSAMSQVGGTP